MSRVHLMDDKLFGIRISVIDENRKRSDGRELKYYKDRAASEWGRKVAEKKGWITERMEDANDYELFFYVLTGRELRDIINNEIARISLKSPEALSSRGGWDE